MSDTLIATPLPRDIDQLRNLLARIKAGEAGIHLGSRALKVFTALLDTPRHAAVYSISQLADSLGVNASTLTRLAKKLGYSGFNEFQNVFRDHIAATGHFYTEQAGRLLRPGSEAESSTIDLLARVAEVSCGIRLVPGLPPQTAPRRLPCWPGWPTTKPPTSPKCSTT